MRWAKQELSHLRSFWNGYRPCILFLLSLSDESPVFLLLGDFDCLPCNNQVIPTEADMRLLFLYAGQVKGCGDLCGDKKGLSRGRDG